MIRKILTIVFMLFITTGAFGVENWDSQSAIERVNTIGNKIISANGIKANVEFKVANEDAMNAYANLNKEVYVYKGLLENVTNDEELAAVISHEVGHILNGHCAKQGVLNTGVGVLASLASRKVNSYALAAGQQLASAKFSRNDEFEADLTGVDLMTKAGYNPLAMISVLNKICGNYIDILQTHPSGEKRLLNIYNYVEYNYPNKIKQGFQSDSYEKALLVISPVVQKRNTNPSLKTKYVNQQKKLLNKKAKRSKKMANSSTVWDGYFNALTMFAQ